MPEALGEKGEMGGTMRLGARDTIIHEDSWTKKGEASIASLVYRGAASVPERHRHRYEVNPDVVPELEKAGLRFVGKDDTNTRMEIVELPRRAHPFYRRPNSTRSSRAGRRTRARPSSASSSPRRRSDTAGLAKPEPRPRRPARRKPAAAHGRRPPRSHLPGPVRAGLPFKSHKTVVAAMAAPWNQPASRDARPLRRHGEDLVRHGHAVEQEERPRNGPDVPMASPAGGASPRSRLPRMSRTPGSEIDARGGAATPAAQPPRTCPKAS